jgi:hypothetical protein
MDELPSRTAVVRFITSASAAAGYALKEEMGITENMA